MTTAITVPSSPADLKHILDAIKEADGSLLRIESEKDQIKAIVEDLVEKFPDIGKKHINKMIKVFHKQNLTVLTGEMSDFEKLYTAIVK